MNRHKLAEFGVSTLTQLLRMQIRITGEENISSHPTVFVPNHFTRLETILAPYVIYKSCGRMPHTLGMAGLFRGAGARIMSAVGVVSVKHPNRNRMIARELMTADHDWVIYPEGGLIKNKKTVAGGRLHLTHPTHTGSPHTGAAMLALKAEISRQRYLWACAQEDMLRREFYEREYGVRSPEQLTHNPVVMQPMTITFHPMRAVENVLSRMIGRVSKSLNTKLLEELTFETAVIAKRCEIAVHFGEPINTAEFLDVPTELARRLVGKFSELRQSDVLLRRQARRLTRVAMRSVYNNVEVNFDHLFATALRKAKADRITVDALRGAILLAVQNIIAEGKSRVHESLRDNVASIVTADKHEPFERAMHLALTEKIISREKDDIIIHRDVLDNEGDFDTIRLRNMTHVLANEIEPQSHVTQSVARNINLEPAELQRKVAGLLHRMNVTEYEGEYVRWARPASSKPVDHGHPFHLESERSNVGVLLAHGYLASPRQVRPLADYLHEQGYSVYGLRLPAHGTAPEHLAEADWRRWLEAMQHGYSVLRRSCSQVVVGGLSLGGVLAMLLAASDTMHPDAVFAINPPMKLRDRRAKYIPAMMRWHGALDRLTLRPVGRRLINSNTEAPELNYQHHPLHAVEQLRKASAECKRNLHKISAPLLIIQSDRDPVVVPEASAAVINEVASPVHLLAMMPFDRHIIVSGENKELVFRSLHRFIVRITAERDVPAPIYRTRHGWRNRLARTGFIRMFT